MTITRSLRADLDTFGLPEPEPCLACTRDDQRWCDQCDGVGYVLTFARVSGRRLLVRVVPVPTELDEMAELAAAHAAQCRA